MGTPTEVAQTALRFTFEVDDRRGPRPGGRRAGRDRDWSRPGSLARVDPPVEPYDSGLLTVADGSKIYWEASGIPKGRPALYLHAARAVRSVPATNVGSTPTGS